MDRNTKAKLAARYWNRAEYYTITANDIGKTSFWFHGFQRFTDVIGRVLPQDIGKRIYERNGVMQVENQEQFEKRIAAEMHDNAEREAIMSGRSFSQVYIPIPGMWTAINW